MKFQRYAKAIAAAVVTGLGTVQLAYVDNVISGQEWVSIGIATIVALGGVWAIPNAAPAGAAPDTDNASWGTVAPSVPEGTAVTPTGTVVTPAPDATEVKVTETVAPKASA